MSVEEAIQCYGILSQRVFSDKQHLLNDGKFKASKLEEAMKEIVKTYSQTHNAEECMSMGSDDTGCKT